VPPEPPVSVIDQPSRDDSVEVRPEDASGKDEPGTGRPDHAHDPTGRDLMAWNVLTSWAGHGVFVVAGFLLPRIIDRKVGQEALGVWDFAWSLVSYFGLAEIGVGSSLSRYVAKYRAAGDVARLRSAASSVMLVQLASATLALAATATVALSMPYLFGREIGVHLDVATPVVALLGSSLAIEIAFDTFHGVITGCHRWDLHNAINAGFHALKTGAMIAVLLFGGGLRGLALVYLCGVVAREITRRAVAYRVCPELRIGPAYANWGQVRRMAIFGAKASVPGVARLFLFQGNSLIVASQLGPAALALYARPNSLLRHAETFINKFAHVLTPTASSLQAKGRLDDLRRLLIESTRFGTCLALPLLLILGIMGDPILGLWMGARYEQGGVLAILAAGYLVMLTQRPVVTILTGLNAHGRLGLASLVSSICGCGLSFLLVKLLHLQLVGAALSVAIPLALGGGAYVIYDACRKLAMPYGEYLRRAYLSPVVCTLPFVACLVAARLLFRAQPLAALAVGCGSGAAVLAPLYWLYVLPKSARDKLEEMTGRLARRLRAASV
jgi:O-antigen/teichoic acid export membrane protein